MTNKEVESKVRDLEAKVKLMRAYNLISLFTAGSGHSGGTLSMAEVSTVLYLDEAKLDPKKPDWEDRDRIYYSTGHKAPIQYCALAMAGYYNIDDVMTLRQYESPFQGHPHSLKCKGIEISAGSLGQGLGIAVGDALNAKLDGKDYRVYCIMGDGEQQEGSLWESAMAAGHFKLGNLVGIIDCNELQIDGYVRDVMDIEPLDDKYKSFGWNVLKCDGHDVASILDAFEEARKCTDKPTVILAKTIKGKGVSFMEDVAGWHGATPKSREQLDEALGEILNGDALSSKDVDKLISIGKEWAVDKLNKINASVPEYDEVLWWNGDDSMKVEMEPTRMGFGKCLDEIGDDERLVTIHVDISGSICIDQFEKNHPERKDRVFSVGIAEQNMVEVAAGFAKNGKIPVVGSYGVFSSGRCWDQIRTSVCYPNLNVKIAGAHAGISVGPDGATHQALEDISIIEIIPNMNLFVPADSIETYKASKCALLDVKGPAYLRFAREATPIVSKPDWPFEFGKANVLRYRGKQKNLVDAFEATVSDSYKDENEDICIIACGPAVAEAMRAAYILKEKYSIDVRVLNIHTVKPIDKQAILNAANEVGFILTVEEHQTGGFGNLVAGTALKLKDYSKPLAMDMIGVDDRFGDSGMPWDLMKAFGLCAEHIVDKARKLIK